MRSETGILLFGVYVSEAEGDAGIIVTQGNCVLNSGEKRRERKLCKLTTGSPVMKSCNLGHDWCYFNTIWGTCMYARWANGDSMLSTDLSHTSLCSMRAPISPIWWCWDTKRYKRLSLLKVKWKLRIEKNLRQEKYSGPKAQISNVCAPQRMIYIVLQEQDLGLRSRIRTLLLDFGICNQVCIRPMSTTIVKKNVIISHWLLSNTVM